MLAQAAQAHLVKVMREDRQHILGMGVEAELVQPVQMEQLQVGVMEVRERRHQLLVHPLLTQAVGVVVLLVEQQVQAAQGLEVMELLINQRAARVRLTPVPAAAAVGTILLLALAQGATVVQEL